MQTNIQHQIAMWTPEIVFVSKSVEKICFSSLLLCVVDG